MKRRRFFQALAAIPAAVPLAAQPPAAQAPAANQSAPGIPLNPTRGVPPPGRTAAEDLPKLDVTYPEAAADPMPRFFTPAQMSALRRVSDLVMPAGSASPGALASGAPEFLDFLIGDSGHDRQALYRNGLDALNNQAKKQFGKNFADLEAAQADTLLTPLRQPWTFEEPAEPAARFLRVAKADVRMATVNSRAASAGRRFAGSGLYWYPLD